MASQQFVTEIANDLQGAVKCALAQRNETNALGMHRNLFIKILPCYQLLIN